jgi:RNA polymerase sigma factor (sigma-70 family)
MTAAADRHLQELRPRLIRLAYRMLGSVADAEDVVQDAYFRWLSADRASVLEPAAFLRVIVTRLSLNQLKSARRRRETYVGPWLPEPIFNPEDDNAADDITLPLMVALERLSPLERAAFLLHDVFGMDFAEVSQAIDREPAACRQLASRARTHVRQERPRFVVSKEHGLKIANAFFAASRSGDTGTLRDLLAEDVITFADGGGKVPATLAPLIGRDAMLAWQARMVRYFAHFPSQIVRYAMIDGLPGFVSIEGGGIVQTTALQLQNDRIIVIYVTRNPDKLKHVPIDILN